MTPPVLQITYFVVGVFVVAFLGYDFGRRQNSMDLQSETMKIECSLPPYPTIDCYQLSSKPETPSCPPCQSRAPVQNDWPLFLPAKSQKYRGLNGSQGGQDGILDWIFENIGTTNKFYVEFGFDASDWDRGIGPNTKVLALHKGWKGLLMDGDNENLAINLHKHYISEENIIPLFVNYSVPLEPDYVSIDIDSIDLWIFQRIITSTNPRYRPRVISVEYNSEYPLEYAITVERKWSAWAKNRIYGASLAALRLVGEANNYTLVGVAKLFDAFFVRNDLLENTRVRQWSEYTLNDTYQSFHKLADSGIEKLMDFETFRRTNNETKAKAVVPYLLKAMEISYGLQIMKNISKFL